MMSLESTDDMLRHELINLTKPLLVDLPVQQADAVALVLQTCLAELSHLLLSLGQRVEADQPPSAALVAQAGFSANVRQTQDYAALLELDKHVLLLASRLRSEVEGLGTGLGALATAHDSSQLVTHAHQGGGSYTGCVGEQELSGAGLVLVHLPRLCATLKQDMCDLDGWEQALLAKSNPRKKSLV